MNHVLSEQIGIDQISISNITIKSIDPLSLAAGWAVRNSQKSHYKLLGNKAHPVLEDLVIVNEDSFERFEYHANHFCDDYVKQNTKLVFSVFVDKDLGNINNGSVNDLFKRLDEIKKKLLNKFGIELTFSKATIASIEINCNIVLDTSYSDYDTFIYYLLTQTKYFGDTIADITNTKREAVPSPRNQGYIKNQNSKSLKIYNKTYETLKSHRILIDKDILRIEVKLKNSDSVSNFLKESRVMRLTDSMVYATYCKLVLSQYINFITDDYPKIERKNSKRIMDFAQTYYQSINHINHAIKHCSSSKISCIMTTSGIIDEFKKRNPYKKNVPKYTERLNQVLSKGNYDYIIHMQSHVDFLLIKLDKLQSHETNRVTLNYEECV